MRNFGKWLYALGLVAAILMVTGEVQARGGGFRGAQSVRDSAVIRDHTRYGPIFGGMDNTFRPTGSQIPTGTGETTGPPIPT
jgi:hypothetical protein